MSRVAKNAMQLPCVLVFYTGTYLGLLAISRLKVVRRIRARVLLNGFHGYVVKRARSQCNESHNQYLRRLCTTYVPCASRLRVVRPNRAWDLSNRIHEYGVGQARSRRNQGHNQYLRRLYTTYIPCTSRLKVVRPNRARDLSNGFTSMA